MIATNNDDLGELSVDNSQYATKNCSMTFVFLQKLYVTQHSHDALCMLSLSSKFDSIKIVVLEKILVQRSNWGRNSSLTLFKSSLWFWISDTSGPIL